MKRMLWIPVLLCCCVPFLPQQISEQSVVINIEVPVRVFQGGLFVNDLNISDFEVLENGVPQKIEAVYLVNKSSVERSEESRRFSPNTERNFYLFFEMNQYTPLLGDAIRRFIQHEIYPNDNLWIVTPVKTYRMRGEALGRKSRLQIVEQLIGILRKDILSGTFDYRKTLQELTDLTYSLTEEPQVEELGAMARDAMGDPAYEGMFLDEKLYRYAALIEQMEHFNMISQQKMLDFADMLKYELGQKYVFIFYEKEFVPQISPQIMSAYMSRYQDRPDIMQTLTSVFDFYRRDIPFDIETVKYAYADASISIHFMYLSKPTPRTEHIVMKSISDSTFSAFLQMSKATGGFVDTSANPDYLFREALDASENYYLLYYIPKTYESDGKFRNIQVRVKGKDYRVIHRLGYFAE